MYSNKFVACIKYNDRVLRDTEDKVFIPFDSEYTILIKNLNDKKSIVNILIDGISIGNIFELESNSSIELERFLNKSDKDGKFKFVKKESNESSQDNRLEDGIIQILFKFVDENSTDDALEKFKKMMDDYDKNNHGKEYIPYPYPMPYPTPYIPNRDYIPYSPTTPYNPYPFWYGSDQIIITCNSTGDVINDPCHIYNMTSTSCNCSDVQEEGYTIKGDDSEQKVNFYKLNNDDLLSNWKSICFRLYADKTPLLVREKIMCNNCRHRQSSNHKFCSSCGSIL